MADKLILNANMICKADKFVPKRCAVEKVIEVSDPEFKAFAENPMKRNYYIPQYKDLMGYYDDIYHGVLFVNEQSGDGLLVNSEGCDYARYSQYIPNVRGIICAYEQTAVLDNLKVHMDCCIDRWLEQHKNDSDLCVSLTEFINDSDLADILADYASESLANHPQIAVCTTGNGFIEATKYDLVETELYCLLTFTMDSDDGSEYPEEVCSANYIYYDKVHSVFPSVETRCGDLYGVFTIKSYGELDRAELTEITQEMVGQAADGWGNPMSNAP